MAKTQKLKNDLILRWRWRSQRANTEENDNDDASRGCEIPAPNCLMGRGSWLAEERCAQQTTHGACKDQARPVSIRCCHAWIYCSSLSASRTPSAMSIASKFVIFNLRFGIVASICLGYVSNVSYSAEKARTKNVRYPMTSKQWEYSISSSSSVYARVVV